MQLQEKRSEPRTKVAYQITFECFRAGLKISEGMAHTINLSEHGALIETPCLMESDSSVILWITAPFYTLLLKGDVVHARPATNGIFHVGVRLTDVIEGNWEHLKHDVRDRLAGALE